MWAPDPSSIPNLNVNQLCQHMHKEAGTVHKWYMVLSGNCHRFVMNVVCHMERS